MCRKLLYLFSFVLVCGVQTPGAASLNDHLVLHLPFDEGTGAVTEDRSQTGLQATLEGDYQWTTGRFGQAVEFTDGRAVVSESDPLNLPQITVMAWINPKSIVATDASNHWENLNSIYGKAGNTGDDSVVLALTGGDGVLFYVDNGANEMLFVLDAGVQTGQWQHIAGTFDGTTMRAFLNGEQIGERAVAGSIISNPIQPTIGGRADVTVSFDGAIDDVKVFDQPLIAEEIMKAMKGTGGFPFTWRPDPSDGAMHPDTWVNLSWSPGDFAVSHDVYIGDNFDDVNDGAEGTFQGNQTGTFIVVGFPGFAFPDGLVPGTTYYWRIDEVNDTEPNSPWKGDVWSFSIPPKTAYFPDPVDGAESVALDVELSWTGGFGSKLHTVYFGDNFDDVNNSAGGLPQGATTYTPGTLKLAGTYFWRVDEFDAIATYKGDVWSFTTEGAVGSPDPGNGAVDVKQTQIITWSPSVFAASHEVYFGSDEDAVKNADTGSPEYKVTQALGSETYDPGMLEWDSTYYWRIDEVNNTNPDSPWTGNVWSFTTANFLIVDDFEDYDIGNNEIWWVWIDGLGYASHPTLPPHPGNGTGSMVGDENTPSYTEETIVHGGGKSMPVFYDNSVLLYSEVELTLSYPRDWTENDVNKLSIWFRGSLDNAAETLYVTLNGNARVDHDNPDAAQITRWTQWDIDLQAFADQGVNLANVDSITLGLSSVSGGSGMMYFDDIRLYAP